MIKLTGIHKWFGGHHVLRGIDLLIREGETLVIMGQSGCGKSVLLKHIIGVMEPDEGSVAIDGVDLSHLDVTQLHEIRSKIGMLFQGAALFDSLNIQENVGFSLYEHTKMPADEILEIVREKLGMVGLYGIERLLPSELSGGMQKRVGLARAICSDPKIILYDEPTTGLDPINADIINDLILRMQKRLKVTSIVVTHDMKSAFKVGNRIAMLYQGRIIAVGTPDEIKASSDPIVHQFITGSAEGPITAEKKKD